MPNDPEITSTMPPANRIPLTLIVAATPQNGIGKNGALPWPMLKKEMAYFARVTKRLPTPTPASGTTQPSTPLPNRRNAVIMGRKTWDSIPAKFRPLKDRTNVVVSSQPRDALQGVTDEVVVSSSLPSALRDLESAVQSGAVPDLGRAFVIGGARVYEAAMELEITERVLLTRVDQSYECDTFFPDLEVWSRKSREALEAFVGEEVVEDGLEEEGVRFEFQMWERE